VIHPDNTSPARQHERNRSTRISRIINESFPNLTIGIFPRVNGEKKNKTAVFWNISEQLCFPHCMMKKNPRCCFLENLNNFCVVLTNPASDNDVD
jgi:hypothetical protein